MKSPLPGVELADRQGRFREVRRLSESAAPHRTAAEGPWIAISREIGSGGAALAGLLGEALGWRVYDREILSAVAAETHSAPLALERFDEKGVREVGEYIAPLILHDDPGQARVLIGLRQVIHRIGREGKAVFVGRGAGFVLHPAGGLRVRTVGPAAERAEAIAREMGIAVHEARRRVAESDAAQREFVRQAFQREIEDPAAYDLVLSPLALGLPAAAAAVVAAARVKLAL
ncbi:MAG TPA: cytidylate kinase family protein [Thermoanaerobaculia bacterium]|nr:cytidylate kinase family protein [Thermoanaerobaculia bacterium]